MAEGEIECLGPEAKARIEIDRQLEACGWVVQRYRQINLGAGRGVAVREFPMVKGHGFADYLLFIDGSAARSVDIPYVSLGSQEGCRPAQEIPSGVQA